MGFATPEDAALDGFGSHARVALSGIDGADAAVLLLTDGWGGYPYLVVCRRTSDGWEVRSAGGACSWTLTDEDADTGVLAWWGEVAADAVSVRVHWHGREYRAPARDGCWLWVRSGVPGDAASHGVLVVAVERAADA